ncbi:conserved hypothetical protein [Planktothrix sp. PCC 11201]|uniref:GmrSD restriction endonuclease domain-containing protein n=1 Tax=Planktothrix sp. PCC 11201 TaxID=1729650 RepID=UPI00091DCB8B|nr:DUF262 domain-containing protein [Planktothrix sp. PCC 11201]SKB12838.1 conserved hypothetical protein [Planktothrix sp. PCC 11201]
MAIADTGTKTMINHEFVEAENTRLNVDYYGADFPVDVLVKRMEDGDFIIPGFQRKYVWKEEEASRFIESLLIGLPTPALFLAKDKFSNQYIVIDGQQRLKTLQYFYQESFSDGKIFKLKEVIPAFNGLTYSSLSLSQRRALDNAIIHCIIISENYDSIGIYYLFERLNTTGTSLNSQEIRNAIYHGLFSELIQELSSHETWKQLYNKKDDDRAADQELILRFLALHYDLDKYKGNMVDFLNDFMLKNKNLDVISKAEIKHIFLNTVRFLKDCIGEKVFFHNNGFSTTLFESVMVTVARELTEKSECERFKKFYNSLIHDQDFWLLSRSSTTSKKNLIKRLELTREIYKNT